jgi:hypothetical protein
VSLALAGAAPVAARRGEPFYAVGAVSILPLVVKHRIRCFSRIDVREIKCTHSGRK